MHVRRWRQIEDHFNHTGICWPASKHAGMVQILCHQLIQAGLLHAVLEVHLLQCARIKQATGAVSALGLSSEWTVLITITSQSMN